MLLDNDLLWADDLAYNGTPTVLDLGNAGSGKGKPIKCFFTTSVALTGCTGVVITDGATSTAADDLMTLDPNDFASVGTYEFHLPASVNRYVKIALEGTVSAGTFSAGIVSDVQSAV